MTQDWSETMQDAAAGMPAAEPVPVAGITETQELLVLLARVGNVTVGWKGFTVEAIGSFALSIMPALIKALDGIGKVPTEIGDLDRDELDKLMSAVRSELELPSDALEQAVVQLLRTAAELSIAIQYIKRYTTERQAAARAEAGLPDLTPGAPVSNTGKGGVGQS